MLYAWKRAATCRPQVKGERSDPFKSSSSGNRLRKRVVQWTKKIVPAREGRARRSRSYYEILTLAARIMSRATRLASRPSVSTRCEEVAKHSAALFLERAATHFGTVIQPRMPQQVADGATPSPPCRPTRRKRRDRAARERLRPRTSRTARASRTACSRRAASGRAAAHASRMASTSACAVGSWSRTVRFDAVAMIAPSRTIDGADRHLTVRRRLAAPDSSACRM